MPDMIAGSAGKEKFIGRTSRFDEQGNPIADTWHRLGIAAGEPMTSIADAFVAANRMDEIHVDKWPLMAIPPQELRGTPGAKPDLIGKVQLVRRPMDGDQVFRAFGGGVVSADYGVLQPGDIAELLQPLADKMGGVDTAGALGFGETIFVGFNAGRGFLPGFDDEEIVHYIVFANHNDGEHAALAMYAPVRVVCANTLAMARDASQFTVKMPHRATIRADVEWTTQFLLDAHHAQQRTLDLFAKLARRTLSIDEIEDVLAAAYPEPRKPARVAQTQSVDGAMTDDMKTRLAAWQRECERVERDRKRARDIFAMEGDTSKVGGSAYALVNAVAEQVQFTVGRQQTAKSVAENALFKDGAGTQSRAFRAAVALL